MPKEGPFVFFHPPPPPGQKVPPACACVCVGRATFSPEIGRGPIAVRHGGKQPIVFTPDFLFMRGHGRVVKRWSPKGGEDRMGTVLEHTAEWGRRRLLVSHPPAIT